MGDFLLQLLGDVFGELIVRVLFTVVGSALATPFVLLNAVWDSGPYWMNVRDGYLNVADWIWSW